MIRGPFKSTAIKLNIEGETRSGLALPEIFNDYFVNIVNNGNAAVEFPFVKGIFDTLILCPTDADNIPAVFRNLENSKSTDHRWCSNQISETCN